MRGDHPRFLHLMYSHPKCTIGSVADNSPAAMPVVDRVSHATPGEDSPPRTPAFLVRDVRNGTGRVASRNEDTQPPVGTTPDIENWLRAMYENVFEAVFGSWLGSYSCPFA
ncbi:uncharacterized protein CDV56_100084, partial [Aspergillus thermomutatus]